MSVVYYGTTFNLQSLSGNLFVNNALMGLVEIPGNLMVYLFVSLYNRPVSSGAIMISCGFFCLGAALLNTGKPVYFWVLFNYWKKAFVGCF